MNEFVMILVLIWAFAGASLYRMLVKDGAIKRGRFLLVFSIIFWPVLLVWCLAMLWDE